jgi:hypothetical protein
MSSHRRHFQISLTFLLFLLIVGGPLLGVIMPHLVDLITTHCESPPRTFGAQGFAPSSFGSSGFLPSSCPKCGGRMTWDRFCAACCPCPFDGDEDTEQSSDTSAAGGSTSGEFRPMQLQ